MAKKLQEWLDEFIENGFSSDVSHWPKEGSVGTNQPSVNIAPSTSAQTILPDEGYIGFNQAVVAAVDNTIDNNIQAGNIKKNVTILGVTGNYEAPEVPTYTGPYTITENSTIAISGKRATQDISVEVPSPTYEDDYIYWKENGTLNSQNFSNGAIKYRDYDNDSIYDLGSWGGSGIYQVEENNTNIIELEVNESTEVTVDGKTYRVTRTA